MKLMIQKFDGMGMFDTDMESAYSILEKSEDKEDGGLSVAKEVNGIRFTVPMQDPTPGFFFSVAEGCDENKECTLVVDEENNKVGAFFKK